MKFRTLGRTGLKVSEIGFGAWAIGGTGYGPTRDDESLEALETAWNAGVTFYDTADTYGNGHSEELLAQFLKSKPRQDFVLASKVGWDFYHSGSKKNFDAAYLRFACDESLKRLGLDAIDLYQLHNPSIEVLHKGGALDVMEDLKRQGKIRFIGISVHTEEEALFAIRDGRADSLQLVLNLLDQRMAQRVIPEAVKHQVGVIVREPLANGLLTGKYHTGHQFDKIDHRRRWTSQKLDLDLRKLEMVKQILVTNRLSLTRAALEYVLDFEGVSSVIPGAKTKQHVLENVQASKNPQLRIEESYHLRELYQREEIFKKGFDS